MSAPGHASSAVRWVVTLLGQPARACDVPADIWPAVLSVARAEALAGTLGHRLTTDQDMAGAVPSQVARRLAEAADAANVAMAEALWEARMVALALRGVTARVILLKGTAYAAAGLAVAAGRQIGDCDILVPASDLAAVEAALLAAGWRSMKPDPYDQAYYRRWMHELPPMVHDDRGRMVDVHHTILPLTHAARPDAQALISEAEPVTLPAGADPGSAGTALAILSPQDMVIHAAAHCLADGALEGGLRNLWDIAGLLQAGSAGKSDWWQALAARAQRHGLGRCVALAQRIAHALYASPIDPALSRPLGPIERTIIRRLFARDDWGRPARPLTRALFEVRGHMMRMPPHRLAAHAVIKLSRNFSSSRDDGYSPRP